MPPTRQLPTKKNSVQGHCWQLSQAVHRCNRGNPKTKDICPQTFLLQQKLLNWYFFILINLAPKGYECLTHHYLRNTKTHNRLQQDIKKMPSLSTWKIRSYHSPITKHPAKQKIINIIQMLTWEQTSTFVFWPKHITYLHHHHLPYQSNTISITKNLHTPSWIIPQHTHQTLSTIFLHWTFISISKHPHHLLI